jgi:hypothetical protein
VQPRITPPSKGKRLVLNVPGDLLSILSSIATHYGVTQSEVVRQLILRERDLLNAEGWTPPEVKPTNGVSTVITPRVQPKTRPPTKPPPDPSLYEYDDDDDLISSPQPIEAKAPASSSIEVETIAVAASVTVAEDLDVQVKTAAHNTDPPIASIADLGLSEDEIQQLLANVD